MPFKKNCPAYKMFSKSLKKHFKCFGSRFTKFHAKLDADTLLDFAITDKKNKVEKAFV
jgi:hypothetical protein